MRNILIHSFFAFYALFIALCGYLVTLETASIGAVALFAGFGMMFGMAYANDLRNARQLARYKATGDRYGDPREMKARRLFAMNTVSRIVVPCAVALFALCGTACASNDATPTATPVGVVTTFETRVYHVVNRYSVDNIDTAHGEVYTTENAHVCAVSTDPDGEVYATPTDIGDTTLTLRNAHGEPVHVIMAHVIP